MKTVIFLALYFIFSGTHAQGVGIGVDYPEATLHINGTVRIDGLVLHTNSINVLVVDSLGVLHYRPLSCFEQVFECGDSIQDTRDSQWYQTTKIGNQCWVAENMNYRIENESWYYNNDSVSYAKLYGRLYTWDGAKGACPIGWHLPSHEEWEVLQNLGIGGVTNGGFLKEVGTTLWLNPNTGATNYTKFNAVPGGNSNGGPTQSVRMGEHVEFWSNTEWSSSTSYAWHLDYDSSDLVWLLNQKSYGLYCRCVLD